jgi:hypothetical protein
MLTGAILQEGEWLFLIEVKGSLVEEEILYFIE